MTLRRTFLLIMEGLLIGTAGAWHPAIADAAPTIYSQPEHESPVRGDPDDLLILAGYGFSPSDTIVYRALADTTEVLTPPDAVPPLSDENRGTAPVVDRSNVPYALTIRLPASMRSLQSYALWVRTDTGQWSNGIKINDARPMWLSPGIEHETGSVAGLPRYLKIIGRNLAPATQQGTRVRLLGPRVVEASAVEAADGHHVLDNYVARIQLPRRLVRGSYFVEVSRDGKSWVRMDDQQLEVIPDSRPRPTIELSDPRFGNCRPNDDVDDSACFAKAFAFARASGGATINIGAGRWLISAQEIARLGGVEGLLVPQYVNLHGQGAGSTAIVRTSLGGTVPSAPAFTLLGDNVVEALTFRDASTFGPRDPPAPMIKLGPSYDGAIAAEADSARTIGNLVIRANVFARAHPAIGGGGLPVNHLFITYNEIGAYDFGLIIRGDRFNVRDHFAIDDSIIAHNVFRPGSYMDLPIHQGAIASQLGASRHVDFSDNVADGASTAYLDHPGDAHGWRAAFFWNLSGRSDFLLISQNRATCTGDKDGDGEAIAFDNDGNTFGFGEARPVYMGTAESVTVDGLLKASQSNRRVPPAYYVGHDVQVVAGPGLGETRRIVSYDEDPTARRVRIVVAPRWDVPPQAGSRIIVGRQFHHAYIVDNTIDERQPLCRKSNRTAPKAGVIGLWAQTATTAIEGNAQYDSDGILTNQGYNAEDYRGSGAAVDSYVQSFFEIRGNLIDGEYDWESDCSNSGIYIANSAAPVPNSDPPTMNFGGSISHNRIRHADGLRGGAIVVPLTWHQGPPPHDWPVINNLLIFHNSILDLSGPPPRHICDNVQISRIGINLYQADMVHSTVLYANECRNVTTPLHDGARGTVRVCPTAATDSCECGGLPGPTP